MSSGRGEIRTRERISPYGFRNHPVRPLRYPTKYFVHLPRVELGSHPPQGYTLSIKLQVLIYFNPGSLSENQFAALSREDGGISS